MSHAADFQPLPPFINILYIGRALANPSRFHIPKARKTGIPFNPNDSPSFVKSSGNSMLKRFSAPLNRLQKLTTSPNPDKMNIVRELQALRTWVSIPLMWEMTRPCIGEFFDILWPILLTIAENPDPMISVSVSSVIGAIIFSIAPFCASVVTSFSTAVQQKTMPSNASILILGTFLNLVNVMSPAAIDEFLTNTPIVIHFGADVSSHVQHLPRMIELMAPLEVEFHQNLLKQLITTFGRAPNDSFVDSVVRLVAFKPDVLLTDLLGFLEGNRLDGTTLALGPRIFARAKMFEIAGSDVRCAFVNVALNAVKDKECSLTNFEYACRTLAYAIERSNGETLRDLRDRIKPVFSETYPRHRRQFLLMLADDFDEFMFEDDDTGSMKNVKLTAMAKHLVKTKNEHEMRRAMNMLYAILGEKSGEVLTNAFTLLRTCFSLFYATDVDETRKILTQALSCDSLSWVQDAEMLTCILGIGIDVGCGLIDDFQCIVIEKAVVLSQSQYSKVSRLAMRCLKEVVTTENLDTIVYKLRCIGLFDEFQAMKYIEALSSLYDGVKSPRFDLLAPFVVELIELHDNAQIAGVGFDFLLRLNYFKVSVSFMNVCLDWIVRLYKSLTQCISVVHSPLKGREELPNVLTSIDTDVISSQIAVVRKTQLRPLEACAKYFVSLSSTDDQRAVKILTELVPIFPDMLGRAVEYIASISQGFHRMVSAAIYSTNSFSSAAACCEFMCFSPPEVREYAVKAVKSMIRNKRVNSGALVFSFYRFLHFSNVDEAGDLLAEARERLSGGELAALEAKLCVGDGTLFADFAAKTPFAQWPVNDEDFCKMLESHTEQIEVDVFDNMGLIHWQFIFEHRDKFKPKVFAEYRVKHPHTIKKFEIAEPERALQVEQIAMELKSPSVLPLILDGTYKFERIFVSSFFRFSAAIISQEAFNLLFRDSVDSLDGDVIGAAITYSERMNMSFDKSYILSSFDQLKCDDRVLRPLARHLTTEDIALPESVDMNSVRMCPFTMDSAAMVINGDAYLIDYLTSMKIKSSNFIYLTRVLTEFELASEPVIMWCVKQFARIVTKWKHVTACLRFLRAALDRVDGAPALFGRLFACVNSDVTSVDAELSKALLKLFRDIEVNDGIVKALESSSKVSTTFAPYFTTIVALHVESGVQMLGISRQAFWSVMSSHIPSVVLNALSAIAALLSGRDAANWTLFKQFSYVFFDMAGHVGKRPLFDRKVDTVLNLIVNRAEFKRDDATIASMCNLVFASKANTSYFAARVAIITALLPVMPQPFKKYENFMMGVINAPYRDPIALSLTSRGIRWIIEHQNNEDERSQLTLALVNCTFKYVAKSSGSEDVSAFMDALWLPLCDFDAAFTGIWKLGWLDFPMLEVLVMMHAFKKRCDENQVSAVKRMIRLLYESFDNKKKVEALDRIFNDDPMGGARIIYAIE